MSHHPDLLTLLRDLGVDQIEPKYINQLFSLSSSEEEEGKEEGNPRGKSKGGKPKGKEEEEEEEMAVDVFEIEEEEETVVALDDLKAVVDLVARMQANDGKSSLFFSLCFSVFFLPFFLFVFPFFLILLLFYFLS